MPGDAYPSLKITKQSKWRGDLTHEWSNRYHFTGGTPVDNTHWETLRTAVVNAEKAIFTSGIKITDVQGYEAGSDLSVFGWTGSTTCTNASSGNPMMGEICALCRWKTAARTTFNHPIYLFKYWHGVNGLTSDDNLLDTTQKTAMETYAAAWVTGFSDGTNTLRLCGPNGASGSSPTVDQYLRTHSFPAR